MLVKYSNSKKQITMGILSMAEEFRSIEIIQQVIDRFSKNNRQIYLEQKDGAYIGVALIILEEECVIVDHLVFIADQSTVANEDEVLRSLASIYPDYHLMGTIKTSSIIERFEMGQFNEEK